MREVRTKRTSTTSRTATSIDSEFAPCKRSAGAFGTDCKCAPAIRNAHASSTFWPSLPVSACKGWLTTPNWATSSAATNKKMQLRRNQDRLNIGESMFT